MMVTLSEEHAVDRHDLCETFADLLFSVEVTKGNVFVTLGVARLDHRRKPQVREEVPIARLVLSHQVTKELAAALKAAVDARDKVTSDDHRAALTLAKRRSSN
jgi:hypothetical protein